VIQRSKTTSYYRIKSARDHVDRAELVQEAKAVASEYRNLYGCADAQTNYLELTSYWAAIVDGNPELQGMFLEFVALVDHFLWNTVGCDGSGEVHMVDGTIQNCVHCNKREALFTKFVS
jgi:hypothetical protein